MGNNNNRENNNNNNIVFKIYEIHIWKIFMVFYKNIPFYYIGFQLHSVHELLRYECKSVIWLRIFVFNVIIWLAINYLFFLTNIPEAMGIYYFT